MIVYKDYIVFNVMGQEINLISDEIYCGRNTVIEVNDQYHYVGSEPPTIATAIFAWQRLNNQKLTTEELKQVMLDNHLISEAI